MVGMSSALGVASSLTRSRSPASAMRKLKMLAQKNEKMMP
jgi:hypothetical protein